jgi:hypothetical protein
MDAKQARKLLDEVCADLDRRRNEMSAALGRYARPVGFSLALGLSGIAGCGSNGEGADAPGVQDAYGATVDLYVPRAEAAYGVAIHDASPDLYGVADLRSSAVEVYGAADLPDRDAADAKAILGPSLDAYGVWPSDAPSRADAGNIDGPSKPSLDGGSVDAESVDGGKID